MDRESLPAPELRRGLKRRERRAPQLARGLQPASGHAGSWSPCIPRLRINLREMSPGSGKSFRHPPRQNIATYFGKIPAADTSQSPAGSGARVQPHQPKKTALFPSESQSPAIRHATPAWREPCPLELRLVDREPSEHRTTFCCICNKRL